MFKNKFVVCIKVNNKVLREFKDTVKLPFGSEYSILLKNLNTVRAQVSITVDGTNATEDVCLVIEPNSELELTRFIKNGNLSEGNCFKFIERTEGIEKHRGVKAEDGLIRVEFQFEKPQPRAITVDDLKIDIDKIKDDVWKLREKTRPLVPNPYYPPIYPYYPPLVGSPPNRPYQPDVWCSTTITSQSIPCGNAATPPAGYSCNSEVGAVMSTSLLQGTLCTASVGDVGITAPGSISDQKFSIAPQFVVESEKHVIVLHLVGEIETGVQVKVPVTVKAKPKCTTCGRINKSTSKFCTDCGTSLIIV